MTVSYIGRSEVKAKNACKSFLGWRSEKVYVNDCTKFLSLKATWAFVITF